MLRLMLVAGFLIMGLSAFGCGETGPGEEPEAVSIGACAGTQWDDACMDSVTKDYCLNIVLGKWCGALSICKKSIQEEC